MNAPAEKRRLQIRLTSRNREWVRAHVLEGKSSLAISAECGIGDGRVREVLRSPEAQAWADQLLAEHARQVRGRVAKLAERAADVIERNLDPESDVADYVRSADARFVLEKTAFPLDLAPLAEAIKDPLSEFTQWLAKGVAPAPADPLSSTQPQPSSPPLGVNGRAHATNGTGYGSSRG